MGAAWSSLLGTGWSKSLQAVQESPLGQLAKVTISLDGVLYTAILFIPIPIGFFFKNRGLKVKKYGAAAVGLALMLTACNIHTLHSLATILGTWFIISISPRNSCNLTLGWTFSYLLFFHKFTSFKFPQLTHLTKSVQLLLTLKMVSLASDVQEFVQAKKQDGAEIGGLPQIPGLVDILCYSYCYMGLMTGLFYRYRTYYDWLNHPDPSAIPRWKPLLYRFGMTAVFVPFFLVVSHFCPPDYVQSDTFYERGLAYRLFYMMPVSLIFRLRNYVTWFGAESTCITAGLGAYLTSAQSQPGRGPTAECEPLRSLTDGEASCTAYDYATIRNIDPYGTDFCASAKEGIHYWNMTVQWWFSQFIYKRLPFDSYFVRTSCTMFVSAYWHGLRPGYYLSFLTIPFCLVAERSMEEGVLMHLSPSGRFYGDWMHWFLKMRAYDYVCTGFLLRSFEGTLRYWHSVYFCVHGGALGFLIMGKTLGALRKHRSVEGNDGALDNQRRE